MNNKEISIFTFNIFSRICRNFYGIINYLELYNPNILCTQEDVGIDQYNPIGKYISRINNPNGTNGIYTKNGDYINYIKYLQSESYNLPNASIRNSIIFSYKNIIIANLHLEGGRFVDESILKYNTDKYHFHKINLLYLLMSSNPKPDIILGDFNSVYNTDKRILKKYLENQYEYFTKIKGYSLTIEEKENIDNWNLTPIKYLESIGYTYAKPINEENMITNGRGDSIIDLIFYNKYKLKLIDCHIINVMNGIKDYSIYNAISDHNPVYAKFIIE